MDNRTIVALVYVCMALVLVAVALAKTKTPDAGFIAVGIIGLIVGLAQIPAFVGAAQKMKRR